MLGSICAGLIFGGDFVNVVDDEGVYGDFLWDELEAKLLLESGEEVGKFGVCGIAWGVFGGKIQVEG
jgi:hypothetical protein